MTTMTDDQFAEASKATAATLLQVMHATGIERNDTANIAGAALTEVLAQMLGPFAAVERLRDLADTFERQMLKTTPPN